MLFVCVLAFATVVAVRLGRAHPVLGGLALLLALTCLARMGMEAAGRNRGALQSVAPVSFLLLVAVMAVLSFRGSL